MAALEAQTPGVPRAAGDAGTLSTGTLVSAALAVCVAQVALAIPAVLNGLFQLDLGTSASQLTWISDAFLVPVTLFELSFGVLGDLFGRKRLLVGGAVVLAVGELISVLTPGTGSSTDTRVLILWIGSSQRARLAAGRAQLQLTRGPFAGLARSDHDCRRTVRAAVRGHPGLDRRAGAASR